MNPNRVWKLHAPAYGLSDAPVEFRKSLKRYLLKSEFPPKLVVLRYEVSTLNHCLYMVYNSEKEAAGVFSSHIDDILGCGAPEAPDIIWNNDLALSKFRRLPLCMWEWDWRRNRTSRRDLHRRSSRDNRNLWIRPLRCGSGVKTLPLMRKN